MKIWIKKLSRIELELKYEMCLDHIGAITEESRIEREELKELRHAMTVLSEGLGILTSIATVAKPCEYETIFRDYAPYKNLRAAYFPKAKKNNAMPSR